MYTGDKITISIAGNITFGEVYKKIKESFGEIKKFSNTNNIEHNKSMNLSSNNINGIKKEIEQFNLCIGLPGPSINSSQIYSYLILNNIFTNNDSSRLYQSIRGEGLAYCIYSSLSSYRDMGNSSIYMGLNHKEVNKTLSIIDNEMNLLNNKYISYEELQKNKEQLKINYILENESSLSRMFENAKSVSLLGEIETQDEILNKIDKIDKTDIAEVINKSFKRDGINISYIANVNKKEIVEKQIKERIFHSI